MRWSEDEYQRFLHKGQPIPLTEKAWQSIVVRLAKQNNWLSYHTFDSRRSPSGFVDCVIAKAGSPLLCVELKTDAGQVTPAQQAWLTALAGCTGVVAEIWRPSMVEEICQKLR
jgi:hypothetical protein